MTGLRLRDRPIGRDLIVVIPDGAFDAAGIDYHWNGYLQGTHAWAYGRRSLEHYLLRLMRFFERR